MAVSVVRRAAQVELPEFRPILGSEKTRFYRNKLEFTFSNKRWLTEEEVKQDVKYDQMNAVGFHIPGAFDKVLAIDKCWLQDDISNQIRNAVRDYAYAHNFSFFDLRSQEGLLRNIMIRTSSTGELMVVLQCKVTGDDDRRKMEEILQFMADQFPQITSLMYVINNKCNDTIGDLDVEVFKGNDHIFEEMEGLRFKVGPKSFYQTNSEQAYNLYKVAREFAGLTGNELVYDLYTGTGTIANFVARQARKCARSHRGCQGELSSERHRQHAVLCGRHEGHPHQRLHRGARTARCHHHRPSPRGHAQRRD